MIILNQNKDAVLNLRNIECIDIEEGIGENGRKNFEIYANTLLRRKKLGEYSTKERAKEIIQLIWNQYSLEEIFKRTDADLQNKVSEKFVEEGKVLFTFKFPKE